MSPLPGAVTSSRLGRQDFSLAVHHLESGVRAWATHGLPGSLAHSRSPTRAHQGHALTTHPLTLLLPHHSVSHLIPLGQAWAQSGPKAPCPKAPGHGFGGDGKPCTHSPTDRASLAPSGREPVPTPGSSCLSGSPRLVPGEALGPLLGKSSHTRCASRCLEGAKCCGNAGG